VTKEKNKINEIQKMSDSVVDSITISSSSSKGGMGPKYVPPFKPIGVRLARFYRLPYRRQIYDWIDELDFEFHYYRMPTLHDCFCLLLPHFFYRFFHCVSDFGVRFTNMNVGNPVLSFIHWILSWALILPILVMILATFIAALIFHFIFKYVVIVPIFFLPTAAVVVPLFNLVFMSCWRCCGTEDDLIEGFDLALTRPDESVVVMPPSPSTTLFRRRDGDVVATAVTVVPPPRQTTAAAAIVKSLTVKTAAAVKDYDANLVANIKPSLESSVVYLPPDRAFGCHEL
jgi:hypothetical protein